MVFEEVEVDESKLYEEERDITYEVGDDEDMVAVIFSGCTTCDLSLGRDTL